MALGGIAVQALDLAAHLGGGIEVRTDGNGIVQFASKGGQTLNIRVEAGEGGFPGVVVLKHRGQVPLELRVEFAAVF